MAVTWLFPLLWAAYTSLRPYGETLRDGFISLPTILNFNNYFAAFERGEFPQFYLNSLLVTIPAVIAVLFISSMLAFAVTRFSWRFNLLLPDAVHGRKKDCRHR